MIRKTLTNMKGTESLIGAVVGVGLFGIPFAFVKAGYVIGMTYLVILGLIMMTLFMMFAEVSLQTPGKHRMSGYAKKYLGRKMGLVTAFISMGKSWGGLIAYILVGGGFVHALLSPQIGGSLFLYQTLFLATGFIIALRGLAFVTKVEAYLVAALIIVVSIIVIKGSFVMDLSNLLEINPKNMLLPYGVVLFSLGGLDIVPEIKDVLGRNKKAIRKIIPIAFAVIVAIYAAFATVVVGVTGDATTIEAITGLGKVLGHWAIIVGAILGLLAVATSFILMAVGLQDMLEFDFGYTKLLAWFVTMSVPTIIFMLGAKNFVEVMSFTGAVFGGLLGVIVIIMYLKITKKLEYSPRLNFKTPRWISYTILAIFVLGVLAGICERCIIGYLV